MPAISELKAKTGCRKIIMDAQSHAISFYQRLGFTITSEEYLEASDKEQFIKDNQEAFNYGALEEFGTRDNHFEEDEQDGQLKLSLNIVTLFCFFNLYGLFLTDSQYSPSEEWNAAYNLVQRVAQCKACRKAQNVNCPCRNAFRLSE